MENSFYDLHSQVHGQGQEEHLRLNLNLAKELKFLMSVEINKLQSTLKQVLGYLGLPFEFNTEITDIINQILERLES